MGVGLKDSLIDANGFPRADVDIYRARQIRSELSSASLFFTLTLATY